VKRGGGSILGTLILGGLAAILIAVFRRQPTHVVMPAPKPNVKSDRPSDRRPPKDALKVGLTLVVLGLLGLMVGASTQAAFSDTSANSGNAFVVGTVDIDDNDGGAAMLSLSNATPGANDIACITVTFNGSLDSRVWLYGTTTGSGLDQYLDLKVERGAFSPSAPAYDSCTNFVPDSTNYIGAGSGVVYNGTLQGFPDSQGAGILDPIPGTPETWAINEAHAYRLTATLQDNNAAQGLNATQTFTWEARNI
jgi:hypothetical protein